MYVDVYLFRYSEYGTILLVTADFLPGVSRLVNVEKELHKPRRHDCMVVRFWI